MTNVQIQCCHCKGDGQLPDYRVFQGQYAPWTLPTDPYRMVNCPTCNGFGVVIATELRAVTNWEQIRRPVAERLPE